MILLKYCWKWH